MWLKFYLWSVKHSAGKQAVAELHTVLNSIKDRVEGRGTSGLFDSGTGVCGNVHLYGLSHKANVLFANLLMEWPEAGPSVMYPVDGSAEFSQGREEGALWHNPRRMELLSWLIKVTK